MIRGYKADIDPAAVGLGFEAIVFVTLRQVDRSTMEIFENRVADNPNIVEAQPAACPSVRWGRRRRLWVHLSTSPTRVWFLHP